MHEVPLQSAAEEVAAMDGDFDQCQGTCRAVGVATPAAPGRVAIPLAWRAELLLSPLGGGGPERYAVKDLTTGECCSLGEEEYFLLTRLDGRQTAPAICRAFQERFGQGLFEAELGEFFGRARAQGLLQDSGPQPALQEATAAEDSPGPGCRMGPPTSPPGPLSGAKRDDSVVQTSCRYDEVPYDSRPFPQTHPDNLATVAALFGMRSPPVERCRVLELGCAGGGNLIPLAVTLPASRFVGIDLSGRQIGDGRRVVNALGLRNIELHHLSILDVGADLGEFDYILCHGVYSWVPAPVQDKILEICARQLAPNGVAYVSYNTYPGWHLPEAVRAMMRFHADRFAEPTVRVRQARALLELLAGAAPPENDPYGGALRKELELLRGVPDHYLYHEYLAEVNTPVYFHEFAARAGGWGLQYLGEAAFREMLTEQFPPDVGKTLGLLAPDLVGTEQYIDFLRHRRFRQTLLCHKGVSLNRALGVEYLEGLHVASAYGPVSARPDVHSDAAEEFRTPRGSTLSTDQPLLKAALVHLAEAWPASVPFRRLAAATRARLGPGPEAVPPAAGPSDLLVLASLLRCASPTAVEFSVAPPRPVVNISPRPTATPLARLQAAAGPTVTNLRHQAVPLSALDSRVLRRLDGNLDRAQLVEALAQDVDRGLLPTTPEGGSDPKPLGELLDQSLRRLARQALLAG
jgi:methyltransferase-like protein/SAM-dependent methyltransferase